MLHRHRIDKLASEYRVIVKVVDGMQAFGDRLAERHRVYIPTVQRLKARVDFAVWLVDHVGI